MSRRAPRRRGGLAPAALFAFAGSACAPAPDADLPRVEVGSPSALPFVREVPPGAESPRERPAPPRMRWETDPEAALAQAAAEERPLLVFACAEWAAACAKLDREIWTDREVLETGSRFVALRLDLWDADGDGEEAALAARLGVPWVPGVALWSASSGAGPSVTLEHPIERRVLLDAMRRVR